MADAVGAPGSDVGDGPDADIRDTLVAIGAHWGWLAAFGVVTAALGVVLLVWPGRTLVVIAVFLGAYLLVSGVFQIVSAFTSHDVSGGFRWLIGLSGFVSVLLGMFAFRSIAHSLAVLVLVIGFGWLLRGMAHLVDGIANRGIPGRGWQIFSGIVSILAGLVVLLYPAPTLTALAVVGGAWLVVLGIVEVVGALRLRSLAASAH